MSETIKTCKPVEFESNEEPPKMVPFGGEAKDEVGSDKPTDVCTELESCCESDHSPMS